MSRRWSPSEEGVRSGCKGACALWERGGLAHKQYVYLWVDGIHFGVRLEEADRVPSCGDRCHA